MSDIDVSQLSIPATAPPAYEVAVTQPEDVLIPKFCSNCGSNCVGGRFCTQCGTQVRIGPSQLTPLHQSTPLKGQPGGTKGVTLQLQQTEYDRESLEIEPIPSEPCCDTCCGSTKRRRITCLVLLFPLVAVIVIVVYVSTASSGNYELTDG